MVNKERCQQWLYRFELDFHGQGAWNRGSRINKGKERALRLAAARRELFQVWFRSSRYEMVWRGLVSLPAFSWRTVPPPGPIFKWPQPASFWPLLICIFTLLFLFIVTVSWDGPLQYLNCLPELSNYLLRKQLLFLLDSGYKVAYILSCLSQP